MELLALTLYFDFDSRSPFSVFNFSYNYNGHLNNHSTKESFISAYLKFSQGIRNVSFSENLRTY